MGDNGGGCDGGGGDGYDDGDVSICWNVICLDGRRRVLAASVVNDYVHDVVVGVW